MQLMVLIKNDPADPATAIEMVRFLLGCDPNSVTKLGRQTPAFSACIIQFRNVKVECSSRDHATIVWCTSRSNRVQWDDIQSRHALPRHTNIQQHPACICSSSERPPSMTTPDWEWTASIPQSASEVQSSCLSKLILPLYRLPITALCSRLWQ
jgi:hypothetical protein